MGRTGGRSWGLTLAVATGVTSQWSRRSWKPKTWAPGGPRSSDGGGGGGGGGVAIQPGRGCDCVDGPEIFGGHEALTRPALRWPYGNAKTTVGMDWRREVGDASASSGVFQLLSQQSFCLFLEFCLSLRRSWHQDRRSIQLCSIRSVLGGRPT